uniref:Phosphoesterase n=1 Tax=Aureoumbra lagunensis TaxID=44058 RepID=A0A7S3JZJ1_9STRA|mmetsp:Transcript_8862/g.13585  ORF Transcript_8862/g.13585 Transcript_8862/m.13585 type:complete len:577 (+) Transcript_8862:110-1840(+)
MYYCLLFFGLIVSTVAIGIENDERTEVYASDVMSLSADEIRARFGKLPERKYPTPSRQDKIDHLVILYMENHAAAHYFGCMGLDNFTGIENGHEIPVDPYNESAGTFSTQCGTSPYVCETGPSYDTWQGKFASDGNPNYYPYSEQDDKFSALHGATENGTAIKMMSKEQVPIKAAIAEYFGVFNKLYTAVPSASSPNHLFTQSGTSCGMQTNTLYDDCGGPNASFPQKTMYDNMYEHNVSFAFYLNSTCGLDGNAPCTGEPSDDPDSASAINTPDVAMAGVARYVSYFFSQQIFYEQAANGSLPSVSWINPAIQACDHPCNDNAKGERLLKDIYEALRASPKWNKTALFVAYDDAGGYYDPVVPPYEGVPADESPCIIPGDHPNCGESFDFRRLGLRSTAMLISPWVPKGIVFQEPQTGPTNTSQFELTSVAASVKTLFNLTSFLTKRDAWAGTFDELFSESSPRTDTPLHLPQAPNASSPWDPPPTTDPTRPRHCSSFHGSSQESPCFHDTINLKQKRQIRLLASLTGDSSLYSPQDRDALDTMSYAQADVAVTELWDKWLSMAHFAATLSNSSA